METYEECLCRQEIAPISEKKLKCITEYDGFGGIILALMYDRDGSLMTMNQCMNHEMQINPKHYPVC